MKDTSRTMPISPRARHFLAVAMLPLAMAATPALAQSASGTGTGTGTSRNEPHARDSEHADDFHADPEIVVTAPYVERLDILAGTSAMSGDALAAANAGQIGEVITKLPGVSATSFSPGASRPVVRGFQGSRVAVLTDGIGNIDASNTSADHAVTIDSLTAERIEVLRGPAVLLFGGQAVGGAVNIIDKRIPRKVPDEPVHVDAIAGYSSAADEWSGGASIDVPLTDRVVAHLDGSYRKSDDLRIGGYLLAPDLRDDVLHDAEHEEEDGHLDEAAELRALANTRGRLSNSATETWNAAGGLAFIDDGGNLGVSFNVYDTSYGIPTRPGAGHAHEGGGEEEAPVTIGLRQYRTDLRGEVEMGDGLFQKLRVRAGYADYEHTEFEGDEVGTIFKSKAIEGRVELVQNNRNGWRGASGLQYQTRDFEAIGAEAFVPPNHSNQFGIFTLQEFALGSLELEAALRYDRANLEAQSIGASRSFNNVSAALGAAYVTGNVKFGANLSRTGRAPSAEELFSDGPHIATQSYEVGNTALKSERSWNGEIYARVDGQRVNGSLTLFANRFSNFIYEAATGAEQDDLPVVQYYQGKARVWGAEAEITANMFHAAGFDWVANGVADYVRSTITSVGPTPRIPPLRLLGGLELQSHHFDLRGEVEWVDKQTRVAANETPTDGFTLVNASATWRPFGNNSNISLIASANNIFDVDVRRAASFTKDFAPLAGRDFRVTARVSF